MKKYLLSTLAVAGLIGMATNAKASDDSLMTMNMSNGYAVDYGMLMLGVLFCSLPTIVVFFVLQKQFAEGITGSVK